MKKDLRKSAGDNKLIKTYKKATKKPRKFRGFLLYQIISYKSF